MNTPPPTANLQTLLSQLGTATPNSAIIGSASGAAITASAQPVVYGSNDKTVA